MESSTIIILRDGIEISKFDTSSNEVEFILSYEKRNWKISEYMNSIIQLIDGKRDIISIAQEMTHIWGIEIKEENIITAVDKFLVRYGLIEGTESTVAQSKSVISKFLWCKIPLFKPNFIKKFRFLTVLYNKNVASFMVTYVIISISFSCWVYFFGKYSISLSEINYVMVLLLLIISTWVHEIGHACGCMKYGLIPSGIGFAFYFTMPVLYTDVSCSWRLKRMQRVLVDVGGMYFGFIFLGILLSLGWIFKIEILIVAAITGFIPVFINLNPLIKLDGYWVLSDLLGVPNLHDVSTEFFKGVVLRLFGVKNYKKDNIRIGKKEKIFFSVYAVVFNLFLIAMLVFLAQYAIYLPGFIRNYINYLIGMDKSDIKSLAFGIINIVAFLITVILMLRVTYYTFKAVLHMAVDIGKTVKKEKMKQNFEFQNVDGG